MVLVKFRLLMASSVVMLVGTVAVGVSQQRRSGAFDQSINHPAIKYLTADTDTVVDHLNQKLRDGSAKLVFDEKTGYLKSVLELLQIPVESQVLVYTQTSLQAQHIKMDNPRAIYFNDRVSVAYIRGAGLIEVVAQDVNPRTIKVADIMVLRPLLAAEDEDLEHLLGRMREAGVRRVPVVGAAGELLGMVSFDDILQAIAGLLTDMAHSTLRQRQLEPRLRA